MKTHRILAAFACSLFVGACAPIDVAAPPVSQLVLPAKADIKKLEHGRALYASACTHCHGPARIDRRPENKWTDSILPSMCAKAKLKADESADLREYVLTARKALAEHPHS